MPIDTSLVRSPTQTLAWLRCREYWQLAKTEKPPPATLANLNMGREVHSLIAHFFKTSIIPIKDRTEKNLDIINYLPTFHALLLGNEWKVWDVERRMKECRADIILKSLDMLEPDKYTIVDVKTRKELPTDRRITFEDRWQLLHYAWRLHEEIATMEPWRVWENRREPIQGCIAI